MLVEVFEVKMMCVSSRIFPSMEGDTPFPSLFLPSQASMSHLQKWIMAKH